MSNPVAGKALRSAKFNTFCRSHVAKIASTCDPQARLRGRIATRTANPRPAKARLSAASASVAAVCHLSRYPRMGRLKMRMTLRPPTAKGLLAIAAAGLPVEKAIEARCRRRARVLKAAFRDLPRIAIASVAPPARPFAAFGGASPAFSHGNGCSAHSYGRPDFPCKAGSSPQPMTARFAAGWPNLIRT